MLGGIVNQRGDSSTRQSYQRRQGAVTVATSGLMTGLVGVTIPATLDAPASSAMRHRRTTYRQPTDNLRCVTFSGLHGQRSHQEYALTAHRRKALDLFSAIRTAALRLTQLSERCS